MILVDTGVLLAAADRDDHDHGPCSALLRQQRNDLRIPAPVIPETAWQIEHSLGSAAEARFLRLITSTQLPVVDMTLADYERCVELIETYADLRLGLVDASIVALAERLAITTIATLNTRDFHVVRPSHTDTFVLLP